MSMIRKSVMVVLATMLLGGVAVQARDLEKLQQDFLSWKFGMFIHFNMSTFVPGGWSTGKEDPLKFAPKDLDIGQWADAAKSAKMEYAILTVKHTGGWCLWQTDTTDHDVSMFKNYKDGKGDIVREFVDAFRSRGMKVGFYYCFPLWVKRWPNYMTLPHPKYATGDFDALSLVKAQFKELLTNYGKIDMIWIDQSGTTHGGLKPGDWLKFKAYIHENWPDCIVLGNNSTDFEFSDILGYEYPYTLKLPPVDNTKPSEVCDKLNSGWFSNPNGAAVPVRTPSYIVNKMLLPMLNRHSNYLLNCSPEKTGKFHPETVKVLNEIGKMWDPSDITKYDKDLFGMLTKPVKQVPTAKSQVALCLDSSWDNSDRIKALEVLKKHGAAATFFVDSATVKEKRNDLRPLVKTGNALGNQVKSEDPLEKKTAMKVRDAMHIPQDHLKRISVPVAVLLPCSTYSTAIWNTMNYYQLMVIEPQLKIDSAAAAGKVAAKATAGDIILLQGSAKALDQLDELLGALEKSGLKAVTFRKLVGGSKSRRLKSVLESSGADVETGME